MVKIMLDAGHDINTAGKRVTGMREFEFNKAVVELLAAELGKYENVSTHLSHNLSDGVDTALKVRTDLANQLKVNAFISIHADAFSSSSANGETVFIYTSTGASTLNLANAINAELKADTTIANRGVRRADFHVLRETAMDAVLIECGFMTNASDLAKLKSSSYRAVCAVRIANGIAKHFGLKKKYVAPPAPPAPPAPVAKPVTNGHVHRVIVDGVQVGAFDSAEGIANLVKQHVEKNVKKIEIVLV
jgi:N-acetylmuramoyl-L-alanine amidase